MSRARFVRALRLFQLQCGCVVDRYERLAVVHEAHSHGKALPVLCRTCGRTKARSKYVTGA